MEAIRVLVVGRHLRMPFESPMGYYHVTVNKGGMTLKCLGAQVLGQAVLLLVLTLPCIPFWLFAVYTASTDGSWATPRLLLFDGVLLCYTLLLTYLWRSSMSAWARSRLPLDIRSLMDRSSSVVEAGGSYYILIHQSESDSDVTAQNQHICRLSRLLSSPLTWMRLFGPVELIPLALFALLASIAFPIDGPPLAVLDSWSARTVIGAGFALYLILLCNPLVAPSHVMHLIREVVKKRTPAGLG